MPARKLDVWLEAFERPIGILESNDSGGLTFIYSPDYLNDLRKLPLSLSLPLTDDPYDDVSARAYFDNLLHENETIRAIIDQRGIPRDDVAGILYFLGADCSGAVSCLPHGSAPVKKPGVLETDYTILSDKEIVTIVASLAERGRLPETTHDPSPVAGFQPKIALTVLPDGHYALPRPGTGAPTTHILKVPKRTRPLDARFEHLCMRLAESVGLSAAPTALKTFGGIETLLISRFDRHVDGSNVRRLHQEDFLQALGLPSSLKYQRYGTAERCFDLSSVASVTSRLKVPVQAQEAFLKSMFYNLMIGNVDNHGKNYSVLYETGSTPVIAPFYDLLCTRLDSQLTDQFSFLIGNATKLEELTRVDVLSALAVFGIKGKNAVTFLEDEIKPLVIGMEQSSVSLGRDFKLLSDFINYSARQVAAVLGWNDIQFQKADGFITSGGGWLQN